MVYRVSYRHLLDSIESEASRSEQKIKSEIIDSVADGERKRSYLIPVSSGRNTVYFTSLKGLYQIDIYDCKNNLIITTDSDKRDFFLNFKSDTDCTCRINIFAAKGMELAPYAMITAAGIRLFPYYLRIFYGFLAVCGIYVIMILFRLLNPRKFSFRSKFSSRPKQKFLP
jgi:hypothetical protein